MTDQTAESIHQSFSSAFFNALVGAITTASGSTWLVAALPDAESAPDEYEPIRIKLSLEGSLEGEFLLQFHLVEAALLASKFLHRPVEEFGQDELEAVLEVVKTAMNEFRSSLEEEHGIFEISAVAVPDPPSEGANVVQITAADDESNRITVSIYLDPALTEALTAHPEVESTDAAGAEETPKVEETPKNVENVVLNAIPEHTNLNLVMDVELNVTLRFGQRKLTLREVLDLTSGSVVELSLIHI